MITINNLDKLAIYVGGGIYIFNIKEETDFYLVKFGIKSHYKLYDLKLFRKANDSQYECQCGLYTCFFSSDELKTPMVLANHMTNIGYLMPNIP
jgi:hypothetical protein